MRLYLAGTVESLNNDMKLFLAESGGLWEAYFSEEYFAHAYILQSFFYADEFTEKYINRMQRISFLIVAPSL